MPYDLIVIIAVCVLAYVVGYKIGRINSHREGYMQGAMDLTDAVNSAIKQDKKKGQSNDDDN
jgi:hypothetical protein